MVRPSMMGDAGTTVGRRKGGVRSKACEAPLAGSPDCVSSRGSLAYAYCPGPSHNTLS